MGAQKAEFLETQSELMIQMLEEMCTLIHRCSHHGASCETNDGESIKGAGWFVAWRLAAHCSA